MNDFASAWPDAASAYASNVDLLALFFMALVVILSAPVFILMVVFATKYRRGKNADRTEPINRNMWVEVSWAVVPFLLILFFYGWATSLFIVHASPPSDALEIKAVGKQWMWKFQHAGGQREINELHVPVGKDVKVVLASQDVIHSLYIPALRIKQDAVPGRYTELWFNAEKPGTYWLACAEFCGTDHSAMTGKFIALRPADYSRWLAENGSDGSLAAEGEKLFVSSGCSGCHSPDAKVHAPSLAGLYGRPVPLENGDVVTADDQYIRDSILLPQSQIAAGYPHIMPTFENILSEEDVLKLVAYVKSLAKASEENLP
ncbi:cytochrome c oxidase subunit II [Rhizobium sp. L1K21]|uniref:cytochrome c oxidase subunit II n=1 Tax=Rhizobium sp. L1K21 TaxID=2954933 RepID=UPI0020936A7B|nr:cytochrome c oxidase subunit II [Rhizobium sp. L1K21]MCO6187780.1 cytochrome c oxidase subunit II [Rhizobium sp. L1K21]